MPLARTEPPARRRGRPSTAQAALLEEHVLATATTLFLERGFGRTTLDLVAQQAAVGKSGLYARYPNKGALFTAVVDRSIQTMFNDMQAVHNDPDTGQRLQRVGEGLVEGMLHPRCVALMRITAAEAENFPNLALSAYEVSFKGAVRQVLRALGVQDRVDADVEQTRLAERFVEIAIQPLSFQAAFGVDATLLRLRASACVRDAVKLLQAARTLDTPEV